MRKLFKHNFHKEYTKKYLNIPLILVTLILVVLGIIMVYSASMYNADINYGDKFYFMNKQIIGATLGIIALVFTYSFNYQNYKKLANALLIVSIFLLVIIFIPYVGVTNNGATRWLNLPFFTIQPSEIAKFVFVIWSSTYLIKHSENIKNFKSILPVLFVGALICLLIIIEPNMSITICVGLVMLLMLFVGGAKIKHFFILSIPILLLIPVLIIIEPYRLNRLVAFINPWANPQGEGYQLIQSLYALGGGGLFGVGLFNSRQKFLFLPFSESDFIFSIIGEELGFVGAILVIFLFAVLIFQGIKIAYNSRDRFGSYLASGITGVIAFQLLINIAVVTGSIPPTGVPLPFISAGSTSLVVFMSSIGILLNIHRHNKHNFFKSIDTSNKKKLHKK